MVSKSLVALCCLCLQACFKVSALRTWPPAYTDALPSSFIQPRGPIRSASSSVLLSQAQLPKKLKEVDWAYGASWVTTVSDFKLSGDYLAAKNMAWDAFNLESGTFAWVRNPAVTADVLAFATKHYSNARKHPGYNEAAFARELDTELEAAPSDASGMHDWERAGPHDNAIAVVPIGRNSSIRMKMNELMRRSVEPHFGHIYECVCSAWEDRPPVFSAHTTRLVLECERNGSSLPVQCLSAVHARLSRGERPNADCVFFNEDDQELLSKQHPCTFLDGISDEHPSYIIPERLHAVMVGTRRNMIQTKRHEDSVVTTRQLLLEDACVMQDADFQSMWMSHSDTHIRYVQFNNQASSIWFMLGGQVNEILDLGVPCVLKQTLAHHHRPIG